MTAAVISALLAELEASLGLPAQAVAIVTAILNAVPPAVWQRVDAWAQTEGEQLGELALRNTPKVAGLVLMALIQHGRETGAPLVLPPEIPYGVPQPSPGPQVGAPSGDWP